jgi:hypothetical protein
MNTEKPKPKPKRIQVTKGLGGTFTRERWLEHIAYHESNLLSLRRRLAEEEAQLDQARRILVDWVHYPDDEGWQGP